LVFWIVGEERTFKRGFSLAAHGACWSIVFRVNVGDEFPRVGDDGLGTAETDGEWELGHGELLLEDVQGVVVCASEAVDCLVAVAHDHETATWGGGCTLLVSFSEHPFSYLPSRRIRVLSFVDEDEVILGEGEVVEEREVDHVGEVDLLAVEVGGVEARVGKLDEPIFAALFLVPGEVVFVDEVDPVLGIAGSEDADAGVFCEPDESAERLVQFPVKVVLLQEWFKDILEFVGVGFAGAISFLESSEAEAVDGVDVTVLDAAMLHSELEFIADLGVEGHEGDLGLGKAEVDLHNHFNDGEGLSTSGDRFDEEVSGLKVNPIHAGGLFLGKPS